VDERTQDLVFYGLLSGAGIASVAGMYLLVRRYYPAGAVEFQGLREPLTQEDKLWMARMALGESGEDMQGGAAVLWSVLTRWRTKPTFRNWSFVRLMRAFSQPINPIWATPTGGGCLRQPHRCTPELLARRARITNMPWGSLPLSVRDLTEAFAQGRVPNPIYRVAREVVGFINNEAELVAFPILEPAAAQPLQQAGQSPRAQNDQDRVQR